MFRIGLPHRFRQDRFAGIELCCNAMIWANNDNARLERKAAVPLPKIALNKQMNGDPAMTNKETCDHFAVEMAIRFEDFTKWAMENWPNGNYPLLQSDFSESRKEVGRILGVKLNEGQTNRPASDDAGESGQYVNMNPAPWP
jgi:hypothetical protein